MRPTIHDGESVSGCTSTFETAMIRKVQILFCDNEHGTGNKTFPDVDSMDIFKIEQAFIDGNGARSLRKAAKAAGWGRVGGADYCPGCMESMS